MEAERQIPQEVIQEIAPAEGVPMAVPEASEEVIKVAGPRTWTDREAVDHFGFIPEGVAVKRRGERFPSWK
ncbi:MAG: hypothetical protein Q8Q11_02295 [bacterium]|nr:hypothetical protein [bacterium]MDZ4248158.1 hypothetical protein [Patescibacteria group bacterium]